MRVNFDESGPLFSRIFLETLRTFQTNIRTAYKKIQINFDDNYHGRSKIPKTQWKFEETNFQASKISKNCCAKEREDHQTTCSLVLFLVPEGSLLVKWNKKFLRPKTCSWMQFNVTRIVIQFDQMNVNFEAHLYVSTQTWKFLVKI